VLATLTIYWLTRSRFGFGLIAIRENEEGAAVMGVNTTLYKTLAFALSGIFSAMAGGIHFTGLRSSIRKARSIST
jgi:branched-chain amino acid transport system permease protein